MIRRVKNAGLTAPNRKKYKISNFRGVNTTVAEEVMPFGYSPKSYNYAFNRGTLEPGVGMSLGYIDINGTRRAIKKRTVNARFKKFFRYTIHSNTTVIEKLVAYGDDGKLYDICLNDPYAAFQLIGDYGQVLDGVPYRYNNLDGLLLSTSTGLYFLYNISMTRLSFSEIFTTMCTHSDRVFAVLYLDEFRLYFSDDFNPSNWNISLREGGYITFGTEMGKLVKLISFGGELYLFFEHGIMRMTAYNDQTDFRLNKLYLSVGTINKDTIVSCGDRIMFTSSEGVFVFDGLSVHKVLTEIEGLFSAKQESAHAVFQGGKYYLACNLDMDSTLTSGTNSLILYDVWKNTFDIAHDIRVVSMAPLDLETVRGVLADVNYPTDFLGVVDYSGKVDTSVTSKLWSSPVTALGVNEGKKILREMRLRAVGGGTVTAVLDGTRYSYPFADGLNKIAVMRPFDRIGIELCSDEAQSKISEAEITVDCFGE